MARTVRFSHKMECFVPQAIADGFELLASDQLLSTSDHMRQALAIYLQQRGLLPPRQPAKNGSAHQPVQHAQP